MKTPAYLLIGAVSIHYLFTHLPGSETGAFVTFTGVLMLALAATDEVSSEQVFEGLDQVLGVDEPVREPQRVEPVVGRRTVHAGEVRYQ